MKSNLFVAAVRLSALIAAFGGVVGLVRPQNANW